MSDALSNFELIVEEFEEKLFGELEKLKPPQRETPKAERKKDVHCIINESVHRKLKMYCAGEGFTISEVIENICIKFLIEKGKL